MSDKNEVRLSGTIYGDIKSGNGKKDMWASAKIRVQAVDSMYYQLLPLSAYGHAARALSAFTKDDAVYVEGMLEQAYQKEKSDFPRYQVKVTSITPYDQRGTNPEVEGIDF
jgi:hypothetical protein